MSAAAGPDEQRKDGEVQIDKDQEIREKQRKYTSLQLIGHLALDKGTQLWGDRREGK